ncbi:MAG TPA: winged helix-turn-helix domain-containing protein [Solirubrobacterales bacterium]|nr:winged helix-turn-helix domain-containing protein [Solirubrobacterales bacterium]
MQVVRALANPTRIRLLEAVADEPASARELGTLVGEAPGVVSYHLRVLRATGCVRMAQPDIARRAEDCEYELAPTATPTRRLARSRPVHTGPGHPPATLVQSVLERGAPVRGEDLFGERKHQLGCTSIVVDKQGWREVASAVADAMDKVWTAQEKSRARLAEDGGEDIEATVAVAAFESAGDADRSC